MGLVTADPLISRALTSFIAEEYRGWAIALPSRHSRSMLYLKFASEKEEFFEAILELFETICCGFTSPEMGDIKPSKSLWDITLVPMSKGRNRE